MGKYIATQDAVIQALVNDPSGTASYTISSGISTKSKVAGKAVLLNGAQIIVAGMTVPGTQMAPAMFTFQSSAEKTAFDNEPPILEQDVTDEVDVSFQVGLSTQTVKVKLTLVSAGQQKVQAT